MPEDQYYQFMKVLFLPRNIMHILLCSVHHDRIGKAFELNIKAVIHHGSLLVLEAHRVFKGDVILDQQIKIICLLVSGKRAEYAQTAN